MCLHCKHGMLIALLVCSLDLWPEASAVLCPGHEVPQVVMFSSLGDTVIVSYLEGWHCDSAKSFWGESDKM